jgi:hypothetical protein
MTMHIRSLHFLRTLFFGALVMLCLSTASHAAIGIFVTIAPPPIPVYEQPICPGDGYLWTPGYWAWDDDFGDYYWVPGTWVLAPEVGFLWTPPYWGWIGDHFAFYDGWWGPHIGFYGGINYGFGYFGTGFVGGRWDGGHFFYNRAVMNINVTNIHNVYNTTVINNNVHISYNGGNGGINARATAEEEGWAHERHVGPVAAQTEHIQQARGNPELRASRNMGRPPIAATARPGEFKGNGIVAAREAGGEYHPAPNRGGNNPGGRPEGGARPEPGNVSHARDIQPAERITPNTGDAKRDQKFQQQQDKMLAQQQKEREQLQQRQEQEHQRAQQQQANQQRQQQMEQRHQQQAQQMQQRHQQQQQHFQQRVQQASRPPGRK